jgi:hypothetical protein
MNRRRIVKVASFLAVASLIALGCQRRATVADAIDSQGEQRVFQITGPDSYKNVSVFLLHGDKQDDRDFVTLDQGLAEGTVKVSEKQQEQVSELQIDNQSDYPLFLQEGDRLRGGKQDRTIIASLVIPPKSGNMPLPAFCIEQGRWHEGLAGRSFDGTSNTAFAGKEVRLAAKVAKSQNQVWQSVAKEKRVANAALMAPSETTSLNEALDSPEVKKVSDELAQALGSVAEKSEDAVGVAIIVNGKIEEVDVYPNHRLLGRLYPRLLQSYALATLDQKPQARDAKPVTADEIGQFMRAEVGEKATRTDRINASNALSVSDGSSRVRCATSYEGTVVHQQVLRKNDSAGPGAEAP